MSMQRVMGASITGETDVFDKVAELLRDARKELETTDLPHSLVLGQSDGITETAMHTVDNQAELLSRLDEAIENISEAERLYLEVLRILP